MSLKVNQDGVDLIKKFEGLRLQAYLCPAGVPTIGYGTTKGIKLGMTITKEKAEQLMRDDLVIYENKVNKYDSKYHWTQNQFNSMTSFCYNIGNIDQLTANGTRTKEQIVQMMPEYRNKGTSFEKGLLERRKAEVAMFISDGIANDNKTETSSPTTSDTYTQKQFIKDIQNATNVIVDGIAGLKTVASTPTISKTQNNRHAVVLPLQKYLNSIGYSCGTEDGVWGTKCDTSIRKFQSINGCISDGIISAHATTWKKLLGIK